jgi:hypothetical protein
LGDAQRFSFWEDLTIRENLRFVARMYGLPDRNARVEAALDRLGLTARGDQLAGTLSGGWKQRLALSACLLHEPSLLLLDEPTAGVDPEARREFWEELHAFAATGITVLVSTHYMDEAERCHKLAYILNGRLLAQGTPEDVVAEQALVGWSVEGPDLGALAHELRTLPGVEQIAAFEGACTSSAATRSSSMRSSRRFARTRGTGGSGYSRGSKMFIHRCATRTPHRSRTRDEPTLLLVALFGIVGKEFIQLKRDRLTFAMIVGIRSRSSCCSASRSTRIRSTCPPRCATPIAANSRAPSSRLSRTASTSISSARRMTTRISIGCSRPERSSSSSRFRRDLRVPSCAASGQRS